MWLNNCVGRRNYRYFFAFVTSSTLLGLYLALAFPLGQLLARADRDGTSFGTALGELRVPFAMVIYGFVAFLYPVALMSYHVFLMARGERDEGVHQQSQVHPRGAVQGLYAE